MLKKDEYLCSDLVRLKLSAGDEVIGHLESISPGGCTITLDSDVRPDSVVALECVDCPKGDVSCFSCKMTGTVTGQKADPPLGLLTVIEFDGVSWCPERWQPRHLFGPGE